MKAQHIHIHFHWNSLWFHVMPVHLQSHVYYHAQQIVTENIPCQLQTSAGIQLYMHESEQNEPISVNCPTLG